MITKDSESKIQKMDRNEKMRNPPAFLRNTYEMLQREDLKDVVCWAETGNGFVIKDLQRFEKQILPQYFKHRKNSSFVRQLNMYCFHKQKEKQQNYHYFAHQSFKKGEDWRVILASIRRKPEKKKKLDAEGNQIKNQNEEREDEKQEEREESQQSARSVSLALEEEKDNLSKRQQSYQFKQSKQQIRPTENRISKESMQEGSSVSDWTNEAITEAIIKQNQSLRSLHTHIREQVLNFTQRNIDLLSGKWSQAHEQLQRVSVSKLIQLLENETEAAKKMLLDSEQLC